MRFYGLSPSAGLPTTLSLWRGLFTLLQDEDQDVRAAAADFASAPAAPLSAGTRRRRIGRWGGEGQIS